MSPVSGISLVTPPITTKTCSAKATARPVATSLPNAVPADQRGAQAALDDEAVEQEDRHQAGQAELLADRGDDEVGLGERDQVGRPWPRPRPTSPPQARPYMPCTIW